MVKAAVLDVDSREGAHLARHQAARRRSDRHARQATRRATPSPATVIAVQENGIEVKIADSDMTTFIKRPTSRATAPSSAPSASPSATRSTPRSPASTRPRAASRVSIKALEIAEEKEAVEQYGSSDSGASLGDIFKAAIKKRETADGSRRGRPTSRRTRASSPPTARSYRLAHGLRQRCGQRRLPIVYWLAAAACTLLAEHRMSLEHGRLIRECRDDHSRSTRHRSPPPAPAARRLARARDRRPRRWRCSPSAAAGDSCRARRRPSRSRASRSRARSPRPRPARDAEEDRRGRATSKALLVFVNSPGGTTTGGESAVRGAARRRQEEAGRRAVRHRGDIGRLHRRARHRLHRLARQHHHRLGRRPRPVAGGERSCSTSSASR